jgi:hypothetical protein
MTEDFALECELITKTSSNRRKRAYAKMRDAILSINPSSRYVETLGLEYVETALANALVAAGVKRQQAEATIAEAVADALPTARGESHELRPE